MSKSTKTARRSSSGKQIEITITIDGETTTFRLKPSVRKKLEVCARYYDVPVADLVPTMIGSFFRDTAWRLQGPAYPTREAAEAALADSQVLDPDTDKPGHYGYITRHVIERRTLGRWGIGMESTKADVAA